MTLITELISLIKFPQQLHRIIIIIIAGESDQEKIRCAFPIYDGSVNFF